MNLPKNKTLLYLSKVSCGGLLEEASIIVDASLYIKAVSKNKDFYAILNSKDHDYVGPNVHLYDLGFVNSANNMGMPAIYVDTASHTMMLTDAAFPVNGIYSTNFAKFIYPVSDVPDNMLGFSFDKIRNDPGIARVVINPDVSKQILNAIKSVKSPKLSFNVYECAVMVRIERGSKFEFQFSDTDIPYIHVNDELTSIGISSKKVYNIMQANKGLPIVVTIYDSMVMFDIACELYNISYVTSLLI